MTTEINEKSELGFVKNDFGQYSRVMAAWRIRYHLGKKI